MSDYNSQNLDLDTLLQNDTGRKIFALFLKEFNNSSDNLLTLYLICSCFQNQRIEDRHRIKQILEKTYNACFVKNQLPYLSADLKQKLCDSLKKSTYNESVFNAVKKEIKNLLENEYFPLFLNSKLYHDNLHQSTSNPTHHQHQHQASNLTHSDQNSKNSKLQFDDILIDSSSTDHLKKPQFAMPSATKTTSSSRGLKTSKTASSSSSSITNQPITPSVQKQPSKLNKTSTHLSTSSRSINTLNESTLSLNIKPSSRHKMTAPSPYNVITKAIPVSCQDSELQSVVSGDETSSRSGRHYAKLDKHIKQNLLANKNARLNMPEFQPNLKLNDEPSIPLKNLPVAQTGSKKAQIPLSESDPRKFFEIVASKLEQFINEGSNGADSNGDSKPCKQRSLSNSNLPAMYDVNMAQIEANHAKQMLYDPVETQLDEHLDRVYNNYSNESKASPKMSVKNANLSSRFNNLSLNTSAKHGQQKSQQHHFYQLTSTSKEVDIDSQSHHHHHNHDSGVSTRSVASIERVNDWLSSSAQNNNGGQTQHKEVGELKGKQVEKCVAEVAEESVVKTTVAYYLPGEDLAYISTFNGKCLTLAQFKQLITKKGSFRYFFKTKSDLLDEECVVFQEATDEGSYVPMFNNKVIAKIEKVNCNNNV